MQASADAYEELPRNESILNAPAISREPETQLRRGTPLVGLSQSAKPFGTAKASLWDQFARTGDFLSTF
jgi:hypothetical protein